MLKEKPSSICSILISHKLLPICINTAIGFQLVPISPRIPSERLPVGPWCIRWVTTPGDLWEGDSRVRSGNHHAQQNEQILSPTDLSKYCVLCGRKKWCLMSDASTGVSFVREPLYRLTTTPDALWPDHTGLMKFCNYYRFWSPGGGSWFSILQWWVLSSRHIPHHRSNMLTELSVMNYTCSNRKKFYTKGVKNARIRRCQEKVGSTGNQLVIHESVVRGVVWSTILRQGQWSAKNQWGTANV